MQQLMLMRYDAACQALAEALAVDEVKDICDKAVAMRAYARQAGNKDMEIKASEIRFRAERRLGELIGQQRAANALHVGGRPTKTGSQNDPVFTLSELGIDKHLADRARKYAALPMRDFEAIIIRRRERIAEENCRIAYNLLDFAAEKEKKERRDRRERELATRITRLPNKKYGLIFADPEWRFETWSRETGLDRSADNHYPTSPIVDIEARDVASIAADDCALALWSTVPMLAVAIHVMEDAWGFTYKTHWVWAKDRIATGYWNRNKHEIFLFGTRGDVPCPAPGEQWDSLLESPRRGHSEKPEIFLEMMEAYFPHLPKIELNRRGPPRPGWDAWGNEVEDVDQRQARR